MPRDPNDDITTEFDFGDPVLNDPNYGSDEGDSGATTTDTSADGTSQAGTDNAGGATDTTGVATGAVDTQQPVAGADGKQPAAQDQGATRSDDKGNLVNAKGEIIAAAGAERRHFERAQQQSRHIKTLERELAEARGSAGMHNVLDGAPEKLGLTAQDTSIGLQFVAAYKRDPVAAARWALQETMRQGYNLAQIVGADKDGKPLSGSMDLNAVKAMISEAVAPLVGDRTQVQQAAQAQATARREYEAFIAKHDDADVHENVLAVMLQEDASLSPEAAYWQLVAYAARNGLDFKRPLREQVLSREQGPQSAQNGNAQPSSAQQRQHQMPMPNGSNPTADMRSDPEMAAPDESWDTIVQQSLRMAGFN